MPIKKISYLPLTRHLRSLQLSNIKLTKWDGPSGWTPEETEDMVLKISSLEELETLELSNVPIKDEHLEPLLSNLNSIRVLETLAKLT
jgi:hypothetical protein